LSKKSAAEKRKKFVLSLCWIVIGTSVYGYRRVQVQMSTGTGEYRYNPLSYNMTAAV
jgi:hypothetical protein